MKRIAVTLMVAALTVVPAQAALADPPSDGCARGWELWDVNAEPYRADNRTDEEGNNDGLVCARARGNQTATTPDGQEVQIYTFADNDLPASDH